MLALWAVIPCVLSLTTELQAQAEKSSAVEVVESLYNEGRFRDAELTALRTLQEPSDLAAVDRGRIHRALGFTYVAMGENDKARSQFTEWLVIDPLAQLDSVYVSPKIITVFREAQTALKQMREPARDPAGLRTQLSATKRSMLFPGLGQLYTGKQTKGIAMFASEILLLGAFAYCQVQYSQARDDYFQERDPAQMSDRYSTYNNYNRARYATLALAAGVYFYSLYDALSNEPPKPVTSPLTLSIWPQPNRMVTLTLRY
jgi:tetratricopeptide (TPR) repeat protein